jgi:hypothetical protein
MEEGSRYESFVGGEGGKRTGKYKRVLETQQMLRSIFIGAKRCMFLSQCTNPVTKISMAKCTTSIRPATPDQWTSCWGHVSVVLVCASSAAGALDNSSRSNSRSNPNLIDTKPAGPARPFG